MDQNMETVSINQRKFRKKRKNTFAGNSLSKKARDGAETLFLLLSNVWKYSYGCKC